METKEIRVEIPEGFEFDRWDPTLQKIILKKKEKLLPKTWEEYIKDECACSVMTFIPMVSCISLNTIRPIIALAKLKILINKYNEGWQPDFTNSEPKYVITFKKDILITEVFYNLATPLVFKTAKLRDEFLFNFKNLIIEAKPFLT